GVAGSLSSPVWGRLGDRSSRSVMARAAALNGLLGIAVFAALLANPQALHDGLGWALVFMLAAICHSGVRLGRKVYLVDMASSEQRATYVAVSNTVVGIAMLAGGLAGVLGDWLGSAAVIGLLGLVSLLAAWRARDLPEVSAPG
ncbi:MAG: MFS transporter, partial [Gammaproteobacteria bacterium]